MLKSLYIVFAGIPLVVSSLASVGISNPKLPEPKSECPCSKNAKLPVSNIGDIKNELSKKTPLVAIPACPADLTTLCLPVPGGSVDSWCMPGGLFHTCENTGDNDGDGIFGEAHFKMERTNQKYHCNAPAPIGKDYVVCGQWVYLKVPGTFQDQCCATNGPEPACPAGSCK